MADPLCRWHYALPKNVVEIVRALPKQELPKAQFLQQLKTTLSAGEFSFDFATFQKTAYQLAVQLGLYYIDDSDVYHPRFGVDIDEATAARYLAVVAQCYVAPNPYTNAQSFGVGQLPVNLYSALIGHSATLPHKTSFDVSEALKGCFAAPLGNPDAVTALMSATSVFTKVGNKSLTYDPKFNRTLNRKEFFDLFSWPYISSGDAKIEARENVLTIALECFRANRDAVKAPAGWNTFDEWAKAARVAFDGVDETKATDPNFDYAKFMRQFAISETVANTQFLGHTNDEKAAVLKFLHEQQTNPQIVTWYLDGTHRPQANGEDVKGMGVTATLYFMMELHPNLYASWSDMTYDSLSKVGLHNGPVPVKLTLQSYDDCKAKQCQVLAKMKEMGIGKAADDPSDADYITVNEFLWFVKTHLNEIENAVVEKKMEPAKHKELPDAEKDKKPVVNMEDSDDVLLLRLRAALRTKPFAILAGHSGTGKSRMVRKLAYMTCNDEALRKDANGVEFKEPGNFCMIQVKPNWHDSCDLLGYYSELGKRYRASEFVKFICKAYAYPKTPFFVCLDEMNLAPVEQYFAEYLSAIESRKLQNVEILEGNPLAAKKVEGVTTDELVPKTAYVIKDETGEAFHADWVGCETPEAEYWLKKYGLTIPRNLFVVGTVNMDESTNQFSRKVLDRAMTIEMTDADFDAFGKQPSELNFANVPYMGDAAVADLLAGKVQATELLDDQKKNLNALKAVLASTSFAVAYRFANEYALYEDALKSTAAKSYKPASVEGADPTDQIDLSALTSEAEAGSAASADEGDGSGATAEGSAAVSASAKKPAIPSAFDDMVLMKVLPRISGDEADVRRIFYEGPAPEKLSPRPSEAAPAENTLLKLLGPKKDTASVRKIKWILARGGSYLSFWP